MAFAISCLAVLSANAWDPVVQTYRNMVIKYNGGKAATENVPEWANTTRALRQWMMSVSLCVLFSKIFFCTVQVFGFNHTNMCLKLGSHIKFLY